MKRKKLFSKFDARLLKALAVVLALSLLFGMGVRYYLVQYANRECKERMEFWMSSFQNTIQEQEGKSNAQALWRLLRIRLCYTGEYYIDWELSDENWDWDIVCLLESRFTNGCGGSAVLLDKEGKVVSSSRELMYYTTEGAQDEPFEDRLYLCDPAELQLTELDEVFSSYRGLLGEGVIPTAELSSAYVNQETHSFVPCTCFVDGYGPAKLLNIHLDLPGYELVSFEPQLRPGEPINQSSGKFIAYFYGEGQNKLDELAAVKPYTFGSELHDTIVQYVELPDGYAVYDGVMQVKILGEPYWLNVRYKLNYNADAFRQFYWKATGLFALICGVIAVIVCKRKSRKEKAYQESFRISLTDNLAHDIKTPLMAISGYAENIRDSQLPPEKQKKYVDGIIENVGYTDSLVSRTLQLNHMGEARQAKPERIALEKLAAELLQKYDPLLTEKRITHSIDGSAAVEADSAAMETILENLISNAVKYTPEQGEIRVAVEKKVLRVTNSVAQKLDVKKLKEPFVRGDAARSNVKGNGLGLSLADQASRLNGFKLNLTCTDKTFTAELKM